MYFLKVNIAIALFYLFYRLVFTRDTFWGARRFYLVFAIVLSALHPLISFSGWMEKQEPLKAIMTNYVRLDEITVTATPGTSTFDIENVLLIVYASVCLILLLKMCMQLLSILRWKLKGKRQMLYGTEIVALDATITPFSFFNTLFINPSLHNEQETKQILAHELTHAHQRHSLDVLLGEMLTIVCWINPAAWLLKREMRQNLEFLTDNKVLESGFDSKIYQYHLLQLSYQVPELNLVNKFNVSPLKKRITMMNQQKTAKAGLLKYPLIVPLALALVLSSNAQTVVNKTKKALTATQDTVKMQKNNLSKEQTTTKSTTKFTAPVIKADKQNGTGTYTMVEKMPQYPGGEKALLDYISRNVIYPINAQEKGIQGKVIIRFVVNKMGKVENAEILRGLNPSIDAEGLRVVSSLPDWIPGEQKGKKVSVYYTLPITFKLTGGTVSSNNFFSYDPNKKPVVILDGKVQPQDFNMNSINKDSILSINVQKPDNDQKKAELISKYGEKALNGVIVITSKK
jgi:TonB family protein